MFFLIFTYGKQKDRNALGPAVLDDTENILTNYWPYNCGNAWITGLEGFMTLPDKALEPIPPNAITTWLRQIPRSSGLSVGIMTMGKART